MIKFSESFHNLENMGSIAGYTFQVEHIPCWDSLSVPGASNGLEVATNCVCMYSVPAESLSPKPRDQKLLAASYYQSFTLVDIKTPINFIAPEGKSKLNLNISFWLLKLYSNFLITDNLI